jgi:16S rRNA (cytidine1402-2'-O)-methyltransferase
MPGTLYVVATPIGNLEDVTLRALRVLREVSLIAAEDTRRTARLLQHYSISTRTTSLHEHNERARTTDLIERLRAGDSIALVSDAGTPVVSDPGTYLVAAAHAAGIRVEPIPGASAVVAALSASGLPGEGFLFVGFPPSRSIARKKWLAELASEPRLIVLYEAPHRIKPTLAALLEAFGDRRVAIARELTKLHEELVVRPISAHLQSLSEGVGEFTLVVEGAQSARIAPGDPPEASQLAREFGELTKNDALPRREAIRQLASKYGLQSRRAYELVEAGKSSVE